MNARSNSMPARLAVIGLSLSLLVTACMAPSADGGALGPARSAEGGARPDGQAKGPEMLNAVLWQKTSAEYQALAQQTFLLARLNLDRAIADPAWSAALEQTGKSDHMPPAIIVDLDETVIDNSVYEARVVLDYGQFSEQTFRQACEQANAAAVPGAIDFLRYAASRQVAIFYVSARPDAARGCTIEELARLGAPLGDATDRLRLVGQGSKSEQRRRIAGRFRVLLLVGDNLDDFVTGSKVVQRDRNHLARRHAGHWGSKWIILPNPMYGHWEAAFYDFDDTLPRPDRLRRKYRGLEATR